jgi:PEGA domain
MKKIFFVLAIATITMMTSCATLFTGTKDDITFNTTPQGATIYKGGSEIGKTPCKIPMKRNINRVEIEVKLTGYETRNIELEKEFNMVSVVDVLVWPTIFVDMATGAMFTYSRTRYDLELTKAKTSMIVPYKLENIKK